MSLKKELAKRLVDDMLLKARGHDKAIVLVVDDHTSKIISSCCRMYDIMEAGVLVLEKLSLKREKLDIPAVYFIQPNPTSINKLIEDYPANAKKPQYPHAHLYFTDRVKPDMMDKISKNKDLVKRIKSFVELNVDFIALESRVFLFDRDHAIHNLYLAPDVAAQSSELSETSRQLVSLCLTLNEYPYIRYASNSKSKMCQALAQFVEDDLKKTVAKLKDWKQNDSRERGTLLIVDRSMDPVAPLMHEYTFQAMVNDLLQVNGELCTLPGQPDPELKKDTDEKEVGGNVVVLSEDDPLWIDFRHEHIGQVMSSVTEKFREFKGKSNVVKLQTEENTSVKDMIKAMKEIPEYKNMIKKYHKHMSLAQECMSIFDKDHLKDLGELEQDMATGLTSTGSTVAPKTLKGQLVKMCQDPSIHIMDKLRLMMIYVISQGDIQASTRKELMKSIDDRLQKAIRNLENLGVELSQFQGSKAKHSKARLEEFAKRNKTIPLALMRYLPVLHSHMQSLISYELDENLFPFTTPPPSGQKKGREGQSARKNKPGDWRKGAEESKEEDTRARFIVFVLGGVTFSEMRSTYELADSNKANLYIGSTSSLTAEKYIRDLADLREDKFASAVKASETGKVDDEEDDEEVDDNFSIRLHDQPK